MARARDATRLGLGSLLIERLGLHLLNLKIRALLHGDVIPVILYLSLRVAGKTK
jgi:hypothetical protein